MSYNPTLPVYSIKPLRRAQEAALRVIETMPSLAKGKPLCRPFLNLQELPSDSILKINSRQIHQHSIGDTQISHLTTEPSPDTFRKPGMNLPPTSLNQLKQQLVSHTECQKKYNELEVKYRMLEKDYFDLKNTDKAKEQRYLKREQGFRKIIEELEAKIKSYLTVEEADRMKEIHSLHSNVLGKIETFQAKTSKMLLDQEKDILRFFDVKVNEIRQAYEDEKIKFRENNKKFFEKEEQLVAEMEWIKSIAQKMDSKNQIITKRYTELKAQQSTQDEEERLLKEVMKYKKKTAVMECQLEQYEKIIREFAKERGSNVNVNVPGFNLEQQPDLEQGSKLTTNPLVDLSQSEVLAGLKNDRSLMKAKHDFHDRSLPSTNLLSSRDYSPFKSQDVTRDHATINALKSTLERERKQKRMLKSAYIEEIKGKSELNEILKQCVDDLRSTIVTKRKEDRSPVKNRNEGDSGFDSEKRNQLIEKLVNNEKLLSILHDKTFHSRKKPLERLPDALLFDDDDDDACLEGF